MPYPRGVPRLTRPTARAAGIRLNTVLDGGGLVPSEGFSTFTAADYTPAADNTATTLTLTLKDANDAAIPSQAVTYALRSRKTISASLSSVTAATTTPVNVATNLTITLTYSDGTPAKGIPAEFVVVTASGSNNTIVQPSGLSNANGEIFGATYTATTSGARTITVTVAGLALSDTPSITVGSASLVFESDWSTATGTGDSAVSDGGLWDASLCPGGRTNVLSVVTAASVSYPNSTNVLRVTMAGPTNCGRVLVDNVVPASTTHWGRFYWRNDETDTLNLHPTSYPTGVGGESIEIVPWSREGLSGGHRIGLGGQPWGPGTSGVGPDTLTNGVWYRFEWEIEYLTALTYRIYPRIYNAAGTLLYDVSSYYSALFPFTQSLQAWYALGNSYSVTNATWAREFSMGNEGPATSTNNGEHWYYANVAISTSGWIGPV